MPATTQKFSMTASPLRLRWFTENCFEIKLANGKTIVIDPMLPKKPDPNNPQMLDSFYSGYTVENLEGADYVIINHTHGDHTAQLREVYERFEPIVICHETVAMKLAEFYNIPPRKMFPYVANQYYDFGDFSLETFPGLHSGSRKDVGFVESWAENMKRHADEKETWLGVAGSMFNTNFIINTYDNISIAFNAGEFTPVLKNAWNNRRPNILLKHLVHIERDNPLETMADIIQTVGAQLTLPMTHQRGCMDLEYAYKGKFDINEYADLVNEMLSKRGLSSRMFSPQSGKWHTLNVSLVQDK